MSATDPSSLRARELHDVVGWIDAHVRDAAGRRLGRVRAVFADAAGTPWWIVVRHRGREVIAPVASVYDTRHRVLLLDREADSLVPSPGAIDERTHDALVARYGLTGPQPRQGSPRASRDACGPRRGPRLLRRPAA